VRVKGLFVVVLSHCCIHRGMQGALVMVVLNNQAALINVNDRKAKVGLISFLGVSYRIKSENDIECFQ